MALVLHKRLQRQGLLVRSWYLLAHLLQLGGRLPVQHLMNSRLPALGLNHQAQLLLWLKHGALAEVVVVVLKLVPSQIHRERVAAAAGLIRSGCLKHLI
jgi:hypothetical protein